MTNIEDNYFHGLAGNIVVYNPILIVETSINQLNMILQTKGIYSRNKLKEKNIDYLTHKGVLNGDDYISVCIKNPQEEEFTGKNEGFESSYIKYTDNTISLIISKEIEQECEFRPGDYDHLPGERQIKDKIDIKFIEGIKVSFGNESLTKIVSEMVKEELRKNNIDLPIYDNDLNILIPKETTNNYTR